MAISISGTVYTDEGVTTMGSGRTVAVSVNGAAAAGTTTTAVGGTYTISGITAASGAVLSVYLQGNTEVGVTVTKSTGANMTGVDIYQNDLVLRSDNGVSLTAANLDTSDANGASGIIAIYAAGSGAVTTASGKSLLIASSQSFTMGAAYVATVAGNFTNRGTLALNSTSSIVLTGTGSQALTTGGNALKNLTVNGSGGTYTLQDALSVNSVLTLTAGTLDVSTNNYGVTVSQNWICATGIFVCRGGTVTFDSTGIRTLDPGSGNFYNLVHSGSGTLSLSNHNLVVTNDFTNSAGTFSSGSSNLAVTVGGNWSNSGTFTPVLGTVTFNGTTQTLTGATTFYNLVATNSGDVITFTDGTTQTVSHSVTFQNVTLQGSSTGGWTIAMPSTQTIDHVTVSYSTATGNTAAAGSTSTNGGNNVNWTFGTIITSPVMAIISSMGNL